MKEIRDLRRQLTGSIQLVTATPTAAAAGQAGDTAAPPQPSLAAEERAALKEKLADLEAKLAEVQGEEPLLSPCVDGQQIAEVIAGWTGIPVGRMVSDEIRGVLELKSRMEERIVGQ